MTAFVHPVADEWTDTYAGYRVYHSEVTLTHPLAAFLDYCRAEQLHAIVTVEEGARFSDAVSRAFGEQGVLVAFRARSGEVFDARSGRQIFSFADLLPTVADAAGAGGGSAAAAGGGPRDPAGATHGAGAQGAGADGAREQQAGAQGVAAQTDSGSAAGGAAGHAGRALHPAYSREAPEFGEAALLFDAFVRHQAVPETRIGAAAEAFVAQLAPADAADAAAAAGTGPSGTQRAPRAAGPAFDGWGVYEPATQRWSVDALTHTFQGQMPQSLTAHARAGDVAAVSMSVGRTKSGVLEHVRGAVALRTPHGAVGPEVVAHAADALIHLAQRFQFNAAIVSLADRDPGLAQSTRLHAVDLPLAIYVGPRLVRDLGARLDELRERFDIAVLGSARVPAAVARLSGDTPQWVQFAELVRALDAQRLEAALGVDNRGADGAAGAAGSTHAGHGGAAHAH